MEKKHQVILTITGSDSTSCSGIQADITTISELGGSVVSAITTITAQNTLGIQEFYDIPAHVVSRQIEAVVNDIQPQIVKIGMIRSVAVLEVIVEVIQKYRPPYILYDPVVESSRGERLMDDEVITQIQQRLLPLCTKVFHEYRAGHGQRNVYSSAVAAYLSFGYTMEDAERAACDYLRSLQARNSSLNGRCGELYRLFMELIAAHGGLYYDVSFYADKLNVSSRYLAQVTKRTVGKAPKSIIDEQLIRALEIKLQTSTKTVQEIAFDSGFSSQAHFTKFFKKMKGVSPSAYRKAIYKPINYKDL